MTVEPDPIETIGGEPAVIEPGHIEQRIRLLLRRRAATSSICPSEVARSLREHGPAWRALMPDIRRVAFELQRQGVIRVTRGERTVAGEHDGSGPIRLRRGQAFD